MQMKDFVPLVACVLSFNIIFTDCTSINNANGDKIVAEKGKSVTLEWNISKLPERRVMEFHTNSITTQNRLGSVYISNYNTSYTFSTDKRISSGDCSFPNENGTCWITLGNLMYNDIGSYIATALSGDTLLASQSASLDVKGGVELCGDDLPQNFTCIPGDILSGNVTLCGKPQPTVTWYVGDTVIKDTTNKSTNNAHEYFYSFKLKTDSEMCGKTISYKAVGFKNFNGSSKILLKEFKVTDELFTEETIKTVGCPTFRWQAEDHGLCEVDMVLSFAQSDNTTLNVTVPVANETFSNCNYTLNATGLTYHTVVYVNDNGKRIQTSTNKESSYLVLTRTTTTTTTTTTTPPTTTTTPTTTIITTTANTTKSPAKQDGDSDEVNIGLIAGAAAGGFVFLVLLIVVFWCCKKMKGAEKSSNVPMRHLATAVSVDDERYAEGLYDQVDKRPSNRPPPEEIEKMYAQPIKNKGGKQTPQNSEYDVALGQPDPNEGYTAQSPEELASMYAQVQKDRPPPSIYSELGPGGGRDGPKPVVKPSNYAEAKDLTGDYSDIDEMQARMNNGGTVARPSDYESVSDHLGKVNGGMDHDI